MASKTKHPERKVPRRDGAARSKGRSGHGRSRWWRRPIWFTLLGVMTVSFLALSVYVVYLDRVITNTFEGRRWSVPTRVYARPLELYAGARLAPEEFEAELKRLGYRSAPQLKEPGSYRRQGEDFLVHFRNFRFGKERRDELTAQVGFAGNELAHLRNRANNEDIALLPLEPAVIGSVFPSHGEDRIILSPDETPQLLTDALKVVEDRHFDTHPGFDLVAIARAVWVNLTTQDLAQGGSTLTQQLVRSYFLSNEKTLSRKLKEVIMAVILEVRFTKSDLLNAYVNEIFLGQDGNRAIHGFGLGSQFYFNKPVKELRTHEIATLITVIRGPSFYNPFRHPERVKERRDRVLAMMNEFDLIDGAELQRAQMAPLGVGGGWFRGGYFPAFMDLVREQTKQDYDADELATRGFRLMTTLDPRIQEATQRAVVDALTQIEKSRGLEADKLQVAVVVTAAQTGDVLAVVGGRRGDSGFNRALNGRRPIGSLIKPVVFLAAFESGQFNLASTLQDVPVRIPIKGTKDWQPANFDRLHRGPVPAVRALADSINLATVDLGMQVGVRTIADRLAKLADVATPEDLPSLLLGAVEMTPLEVAHLYGVFASGGFSSRPGAVIRVEDEAGESLSRYGISVTQVADAAAVAQVNSALQVVMDRGTARSSRFAGRGLAGKTGTSNDYRDSWFVGFDNQLLTVVWVGYDDNKPSKLSGSNGALKVWDAVMAQLSPSQLATGTPAGFEWVTMDYARGGLTDGSCGEPVSVLVPYNVARSLDYLCGHAPASRDVDEADNNDGESDNPLPELLDRIESWLSV